MKLLRLESVRGSLLSFLFLLSLFINPATGVSEEEFFKLPMPSEFIAATHEDGSPQYITAEQIEMQKLGMVGDSVTDSYNLGMTPANQEWDTLSKYQSTIGDPTVLNSQSSSGWNMNGSFMAPS